MALRRKRNAASNRTNRLIKSLFNKIFQKNGILVFPDVLHFGGFQASGVFFLKSGSQTFFDKTNLEFYKELNNLFKSIEHKPFNPNSDKNQKFLRETLSKIKTLPDTINLNKEIEQLLKLLK